MRLALGGLLSVLLIALGTTAAVAKGSDPKELTLFSGELFFRADDGITGEEVWKTDGVETVRVTDGNPGSGNFFPAGISLARFTPFENQLYFIATANGVNGTLWRTDGSSTVQVMGGFSDINMRGAGSNLFHNPFTRDLYFNASGLWKVDHLEHVTRIADVFMAEPSVFLGDVYFRGRDPAMGSELWKTDGINTVQVADIWPGSKGSSPRELVPFGDNLYFNADDGMTGFEPWKTNGTTTVQVADIFLGSEQSAPFDFTECNGILYFRATDEAVGRELFKTDGTSTELAADINVGRHDSDPGFFTVFRDELYFSAEDGVHGQELWKTDGTNFTRVADINNGATSSWPHPFATLNDELYFAADNGITGRELWKTDGINTVQVADIFAGKGSSTPEELTVLNGELYFSASGPTGRELWKTDGTTITQIPVRGLGHPQEFQIDSASRYLYSYVNCIGEGCGPNEEGGDDHDQLGTWEVEISVTKAGEYGDTWTNMVQASTIDEHQLSGTLTASTRIENRFDEWLEHPGPVGMGETTDSFGVGFTTYMEASYRLVADLDVEFIDLGSLPESRATVSLTGPAGEVFSYEIVNESGSLTVSDVVTVPAGAYDFSASVSTRLDGHKDPIGGTFVNQAAIKFSFIPIPEPSTLLLCIVALGVVAGWRKWGG